MTTAKKTKITYVISGLGIGGAEVLVKDIVLRLQKIDTYDVSVVSLSDQGPIGAQLAKAGVPVYACSRQASGDWFRVWRLYRTLKQLQPDIVHAHLFHANVLTRLFGWLLRTPVVLATIHNIHFGGATREWLMRLTECFGTHTVVISPAVYHVMTERRVVSQARVTTIENGIDTDRFVEASTAERVRLRTELGVSDDVLYFVAIGRLMEQKGYLVLLSALRQIRDENLTIVIDVFGEGPLRTELQTYIDSHALSNLITLRGNTNNVLPYLQAADGFIMPSLWEGLPIALLEAMSTGVPPIITAVGGVPDVVQHKINGYLIEANNSEMLAATMREFEALSPVERREYQRAARDTVVCNYAISKTVTRYMALYEKLKK